MVIQQVLPNSAAAWAGLLPGDAIVGVDDFPVLTAGDVSKGIEKRAKETVTLTILRRDWFGIYRQIAIRVTLPPGEAGSAPPPSGAEPALPAPAHGAVKRGTPTAASLGIKSTLRTQQVKVHFNQSHTCYAIAPPDWFVWGQRKEGDAVDIGAPDFSTVSWSALGVTGFLQNLPEFATPATHIHAVLSGSNVGAHFRVTYGKPIQDEFGYIWQPYVKEDTKPPVQGVYIYRVIPVPQAAPAYVFISRIVQTPKQLWAEKGSLALMVGLSIRCNVQLHASPDSPARPRSSEDQMESTYNQQLGTEYAHNPETGEIYWMNHARDWRENGPQGPGYYIQSGNELKKLAEGLGP